MTENVELPRVHCYRCVYAWTPRRTPVRMCPRCKSRIWDRPKLRTPVFGGGQGIDEVLGPHRKAIKRLAKKYGAENLMVFGSVARHAARSDSDVDLLADWRKDSTPLGGIDLSLALKDLLGRDVDVVSEENLFWSVRPQVLAEAVPL